MKRLRLIASFVCLFTVENFADAAFGIRSPSLSAIRSRPTTRRTQLYGATEPAITLENLSCSHNGGETWQLKDVSYVLPQGAKVALVGRNGTGKSTLLRILAEQTCLDVTPSTADDGIKYTGQVTSPRSVRVAYVEQEPYSLLCRIHHCIHPILPPHSILSLHSPLLPPYSLHSPQLTGFTAFRCIFTFSVYSL